MDLHLLSAREFGKVAYILDFNISHFILEVIFTSQSKTLHIYEQLSKVQPIGMPIYVSATKSQFVKQELSFLWYIDCSIADMVER